MRLNFKVIKRSAVALGFGAFLLLGAGATANAQEHHRSHGGAGFGHYSNYGSSYYGNDHAMRDRYQHSQRHGGYRSYGYGSYSPYASGGYYYPNYNNGYYGGYYNGGGYYNNYGYYGHRDSRNPVKRFFHHALGGH